MTRFAHSYRRVTAAGISADPYEARRSVLSPQAGWPTEAPAPTPAAPVRFNAAVARAFHEGAVRLATACGLTAESHYCTAWLKNAEGKEVARSVHTSDPAEALASLRSTAIALGLLPRLSVGQMQRLITLYNSATATRDEKKWLLARLRGLYADEAEQLAADFEQELRRRGDSRYTVVGEAYRITQAA